MHFYRYMPEFIAPGRRFFEMFQFRPARKWYRCSPQRANCAKPRSAPVADSVSRLVVPGWEHSSTGIGRTMVQSGGGPISHPTGQPSRSWKYVETGTSLYVQPRRLTKLVQTTDGHTDRRTDGLIWGGLGNLRYYLRFLQVN